MLAAGCIVGFAGRRIFTLAGICASTLAIGGCLSSPLTPTSPARATTDITVRTLARGTEAPLPGSAISVDQEFSGFTGADGRLAVSVDLGRWVRIDASRAQYTSLAAEGEINGPEQWTFYLEPIESPPLR